jgi:hypothetical protein
VTKEEGFRKWVARRRIEAEKQIESRFWSKVDRSAGPDDCWPWQAALLSEGYGTFLLRGKTLRAHRVAYELVIGPIPAGLQVDHLCRNRACVNPAHLEAVTQRTNVLRGVGASARNARKTHCANGHEFTEENTARNEAGERRCRKCSQESQRRYADKKRSGRPKRSPSPTCGKGHAFTPENTYVGTDGSRTCKTCRRANDNRRRARERAARKEGSV